MQGSFGDFTDGGRKCPHCGVDLYHGQKYCCALCLPKHVRRVPDNDDGYAFIWRVPFEGKRACWVPAHRWMMEEHLGRKLSGDEGVHHKNTKRMDFRICNLELRAKSHGAGGVDKDLVEDYCEREGVLRLREMARGALAQWIEDNGFDNAELWFPHHNPLPTRGASLGPILITPIKLYSMPDGRTLECEAPKFIAEFTSDCGLRVNGEYTRDFEQVIRVYQDLMPLAKPDQGPTIERLYEQKG